MSAAFSFSFFLTTSADLFLQELFLNLIGRLPTYLPVKQAIRLNNNDLRLEY